MKNIQSLISSLEKYCIFYLSKYTITKKKFKDILLRKITKDYINKKINNEEKIELINKIDFLVQKFNKAKIFNEKEQIKHRINSLLNKGTSLNKILLILKKDKFETKLIDLKIIELKNDVELDYKLLQTYCKKKRLLTFDNEWDKKNKKVKFKVLNKLLREGFNKEDCLKLIKKI